VAHRRVVLAAFLASTCVLLTVIGLRSEADTRPGGPPATVRGFLYPSGFRVSSSSHEEIRFTLSVPTLQVRPVRGREYRLTLEGGEPLGVNGAADLPVYRRAVAVANGGEVSITVGVDRTTVLDGVQLGSYKSSSWRDHGASLPFGNRAADALRMQRVFPETNAWIEYVGHIRGQRIASIVVSPIRWDRASGRIVVATDMDIRVAVNQPRGSVFNDVGPMDAALTGSVLNWSPRGAGGGIAGGSAGTRMTMSSGGQVCRCTGSTWEVAAASAASCGADYLMIVTDSLVSSSLIDSLALRRASYNGFNVAIAKVSQMRTAQMSTEPDTLVTPVMIRSMIDSVYASQTAAHMSDGRLGYVLLVGDAFDADRNVLLPSYYGYGSGASKQAASDAYYSFLDDPAADLLPDVLIGRLPVDDDSLDWELTNVVTKIVAYEPLTASAWADSVLMVSGVSDDGFTFSGLSGFQAFFDSVLAYYPPPGRSVTQLHRLTLPSNEANHETFGEMVAGRIEAGKWLTAFFDHGFL